MRTCIEISISNVVSLPFDYVAYSAIVSLESFLDAHCCWDRGHKHSNDVSVVHIYCEPRCPQSVQLDPDARVFTPATTSDVHASALSENDATHVPQDAANHAYVVGDWMHFEDNLIASLSRCTGELQKRKQLIEGLQAMWDSVPVEVHADPAAAAVRASLLLKIDEHNQLESEWVNELINRASPLLDDHLRLSGIDHGSREALAIRESVRRRCLANFENYETKPS